MQIKSMLQKVGHELKEAGVEEAELKAKLLISNMIGKPKEYLISHEDDEINIEETKKILNALNKLVDHTPIEYITNHKEFMKLNFYADENVLIPRQDTEIIVLEIIKRFKKGKILDLCTGSGAIAISLAKYIPNSNVYASDISPKALKIAKKNAQDNGTSITFIESNMFQNIEENDFDIIVSNPPYIETDIIYSLQKEVQKEPQIALDGGKDGLDFYRIIAYEAKKHLNNNGTLALEIGFNQADAVSNLLKDSFDNIEIIKDLAGLDRVVVAN